MLLEDLGSQEILGLGVFLDNQDQKVLKEKLHLLAPEQKAKKVNQVWTVLMVGQVFQVLQDCLDQKVTGDYLV